MNNCNLELYCYIKAENKRQNEDNINSQILFFQMNLLNDQGNQNSITLCLQA